MSHKNRFITILLSMQQKDVRRCYRCSKVYYEDLNQAVWECTQHAAAHQDGFYPCCRSYDLRGCVRADHSDIIAGYDESHNVMIEKTRLDNHPLNEARVDISSLPNKRSLRPVTGSKIFRRYDKQESDRIKSNMYI
jgi:hypothetical protein